MKALHLEHPVDEHLKPVKDSDSVSTTMEVSKTKLRVEDLDISGDLDVSGTTNTDKFSIVSGTEMKAILDEDDMISDSAVALATQQSIKAYVDAVPLGAYSITKIKVMPSDFNSNDDRGTNYDLIEDDTSNTLGVRVGHAAVELYAFVKIPDGYKATHVLVSASASTSNAVTCKTFNYVTGATTDLETFDFNSNEDITDVVASATTDLVIKLIPLATGTIIYGATVTIASV